jgi:hypothetical protein
MRVLIKITKEVLERSKMCGIEKKYIGDSCAVAVAIIDLFPSAQIGKTFAFLMSDGVYRVDGLSKIYLPVSAAEFIFAFDNLNPEERVLMYPFSFEIEVPEYVIERIGISTIYKVLSESSTMEMVM